MRKLFVLIPIVLVGCRSTGIEKIIGQLKNDPATVHIEVVAAGITIKVDRTNPGTNTQPHVVKDGEISVSK